jgi:hypothetical protein
MTTDGKGPDGRGDAEPFETDSNSASIAKTVQVPQQRRRLTVRRAIADIRIGQRPRKDMGDLGALAASIMVRPRAIISRIVRAARFFDRAALLSPARANAP